MLRAVRLAGERNHVSSAAQEGGRERERAALRDVESVDAVADPEENAREARDVYGNRERARGARDSHVRHILIREGARSVGHGAGLRGPAGGCGDADVVGETAIARREREGGAARVDGRRAVAQAEARAGEAADRSRDRVLVRGAIDDYRRDVRSADGALAAAHRARLRGPGGR